jgi:hypothetical protein
MTKHLIILLTTASLSSCGSPLEEKHLNEQVFEERDKVVKTYRTSAITSMHECVDLERWGHVMTIFRAGGHRPQLYGVKIKGDTITIQTRGNPSIQHLTAQTLNCYIELDTTITLCQYMKKHQPENAANYCADTISTNEDLP